MQRLSRPFSTMFGGFVAPTVFGSTQRVTLDSLLPSWTAAATQQPGVMVSRSVGRSARMQALEPQRPSLNIAFPTLRMTASEPHRAATNQSRRNAPKLTGAGVLVLSKEADPSILLFFNAHKNCWEEAGGYLTDDSRTSLRAAEQAVRELHEESCALLQISPAQLERLSLDVNGRSSATRYRCFFARIPLGDEFRSQFMAKRRHLLSRGVPSHFLETLNVTLVPLSNIRASFDALSKSDSASGAAVQPLPVRDVDDRLIHISTRTVKLLQAGALRVLDSLTESRDSSTNDSAMSVGADSTDIGPLATSRRLSAALA